MPTIPYVTFTAEDLGLTVSAILFKVPGFVPGAGGWAEVERDGITPIVTYAGAPRITQSLEILLDGYREDRVIDAERDAIERLGRPVDESNEFSEAPTVRLSGPVRRTDLTWVVDNIEWAAEGAERNDAGNWLRQFGTVSLSEYTGDDGVTSTPRKRPKGKGKSKVKTHRVKKGETLYSIAAKYLGSKKRWKDIAKANPKLKLRDPKKAPVGKVLRIP